MMRFRTKKPIGEEKIMSHSTTAGHATVTQAITDAQKTINLANQMLLDGEITTSVHMVSIAAAGLNLKKFGLDLSDVFSVASSGEEQR